MLTGPRRHQRAGGAARSSSRRPSARSLRSLAVSLVVVLAAAGAGATAAHAAAKVKVEFSCTGVTYHFEGFPNANQNAITDGDRRRGIHLPQIPVRRPDW